MAFSPKLLQQGASGVSTAQYQISRSLRFNSADSTYLNRTLSTPTNNKIWTWSAWVKRASLGVTQRLFFANGVDNIWFNSDDRFYVYIDSGNYAISSVQVFRDPSAWYHIMITADTTQATSSNRLKMYVNGAQITSLSSATYPTQNFNTYINSAVAHGIGAYGVPGSQNYFDGYMTEVNFIDGQALTPSSFGSTNAQTGVWQPKAYSGSYGTNGFYLNFSDNSNTTAATLGKDYSGNGNNFTPNNFSVTAGVTNDSFVDTPTPYGTDTGVGGEVRGNYCTLNPLDVAGTPTISEGNLKIVNTNANGVVRGTFGIPGNSGKWYWEFTQQTAIGQQGQSPIVYGMATLQSNVSHTAAVLQKAAYYYTDYLGRYLLVYVNGVQAAFFSVATAIAINEVLQFAYDSDTGKVWIGKSGVWSDSSNGTTGNPATGANATYTFASVAEPMTPTFDHAGVDFTATLNCGQRPFVNTAPTGFKALCTTNLPTPTIGGQFGNRASNYFNILTYTGNGSAGNAQSGLGFQPDFLWFKSRSAARSHGLFNAVMTRTFGLATEVTNPEYTSAAGRDLASFDSDGFTVGVPENFGSTNTNGDSLVAWAWKANGAGVNNTDGTITSTVSARPASGFSVVTYASTTGTVGHGLGVVPSMIIMKGRNVTDQWTVYHISTGNTIGIPLNTTGAGDVNSAFWNNTTPTSTVFSQGSWDSGYNKVAYCFAAIAGFSALGSYTGNGSADGPFVYTGFRPAYVMMKRTDNTGSWWIYDTARSTYNAADKVLFADTSAAEITDSNIDLLSNGFKFRTATYQPNTSSATFIYMAFASNPFKYSLAR